MRGWEHGREAREPKEGREKLQKSGQKTYIDVKEATHLLWGGKEDGRALEGPENQKEDTLMCF